MATVFPDRKKADSIVQVFGKYPDGLTITKIASRMKMNRNLAAKYLDYLMRSGQLEMKSIGSAKHYSLSRRVPVSSLMDFSSDLILMLDNEDYILKANDRFLSYLGEKSDMLVGKNVRDTGNPFISSFAERLKAFDRDTRPGQVPEVTVRVNGEENHFTLQLIPIILEEGATGTALILHDITADRNYRQIRDVTAAQHEGLEEDYTEFIIRFSPDGSLTYMNRAFCRFFRRPQAEYTGRPFRSLILVEDQHIIDEVLLRLTRNRPATTVACRVTGPAGQVRSLEWTLRALIDEAGHLHEYQAVGRDITEKREAREKINQLLADQTFLYNKSKELVDLPHDANIYEVIGRDIREILPGVCVMVNSLEIGPAHAYCFTPRCLFDERQREVFTKHIGQDIVGMTFAHADDAETALMLEQLLSAKLVKVPGDIYVMNLRKPSREICTRIEEELDFDSYYGIGLVSRKTLLGSVCLFAPRGIHLQRIELLEIYCRLCTIRLEYWLAEQEMNKKNELM
jgi:PAS domain S-box-containing protein